MKQLDDCTVYVFVRQDIPLAQQLVQASHAAFHVGVDFHAAAEHDNKIPFMCLIGMPDLKAMNRVVTKLTNNKIPHHAFSDCDVEEGVTAIATFPLTPEERVVLSNYRLWRYSPPSMSQGMGVASMPSGEPSADVAQ